MIAQEIANEVKENLALTKMLKNELYAAQKVLSDAYNEKLKKPENYMYELKEKYQELALEVAIEENECPCSRWGSPLNPHEFEVTEEGIDMMLSKFY